MYHHIKKKSLFAYSPRSVTFSQLSSTLNMDENTGNPIATMTLFDGKYQRKEEIYIRNCSLSYFEVILSRFFVCLFIFCDGFPNLAWH